jgi:hypothetical protein
MIFTRSPRGLENSREFKGVELIIYTEGGRGESLTKEQLLAGEGSEHTDDAKFWRGLLSIVGPSTKARIVSVGDCKVLESLASDIINNDLAGVCVAIDRDYRDFWGPRFEDDRVIVTRRYSWESEMFSAEVIARALQSLIFFPVDYVALRVEIAEALFQLSKGLGRMVRCDQILVAAGSHFFVRKSPGCFFAIDSRNANLPTWDLQRIKAYLRKKRIDATGYFRLYTEVKIIPIDHAFGKTLHAASRRIARFFILQFNQKPPPDDYVNHFLMAGFLTVISNNEDVEASSYYEGALTRAAVKARIVLH